MAPFDFATLPSNCTIFGQQGLSKVAAKPVILSEAKHALSFAEGNLSYGGETLRSAQGDKPGNVPWPEP